MRKSFSIILVTGLTILSFACSRTESNSNANTATTVTRTLPDGSEVTTTTDANGVKTETRVFRDNPRISRVVVTTRDGKRTVRVQSRTGEEKEVNDTGDPLTASADAIGKGAGFVADKAEDVPGETKTGAEKVADKTVEGAKTVSEKATEGAKTVGKKTVEGADKAVEGTKKAGKKVKDIVTP